MESRILMDAGFDGVMVENFGDTPFTAGAVGPETVASMAVAVSAVSAVSDKPVGVNILRNDAISAMAVAAVCKASFIRVNVLSSATLTDQGIIQGNAHDLLRFRSHLHSDHIAIFADVLVKHSVSLAPEDPSDITHNLVERAGADAVIVTGRSTGSAVDTEMLKLIRNAAESCPILVGSGVTEDNLEKLYSMCDGFIVGSSIKKDGKARNRIDPAKAVSLGRKAEAIRLRTTF